MNEESFRKARNKESLRKKYVVFCSICAVVLAVFSLLIGTDIIDFCNNHYWYCNKHSWGNLLVLFWIGIPPVVFWFEWFLSKDLDKEKLDFIKHNHDLSRNIWLGFTTVLIALFEIKLP